MDIYRLEAQPLTREAFAPFGEVIETDGREWCSVNGGTCRHYRALGNVDVPDSCGHPVISIVRAEPVTSRVVDVPLVERYPLGSQAFIPVGESRMLLVVAPPVYLPWMHELHAFITNGRQGVNYRRGVWHAPLTVLKEGGEFLVVDRDGPGSNVDELRFAASLKGVQIRLDDCLANC